MAWLDWPAELATGQSHELPRYRHHQSLRFDLHGDPANARLCVFSDGNHHMALQDTLHAFSLAHPGVGEIFYTTTPPRIAMDMLRGEGLEIGSFRLRIKPDIFISPPVILDTLVKEGYMQSYSPFMGCRGLVLLLRRDNPKRIASIHDLLRPDVRLFLSNPVTEKVSNQIYTDSLRRMATRQGITLDFLTHAPGQPDPAKLVYGEAIHHREAPQAIMDERADAALVFYHLALRYQRIFPEYFDFVWPAGSLGDQALDSNLFSCGLVGNGGEWGQTLFEFMMSDSVTKIYEYHGLQRVNVE